MTQNSLEREVERALSVIPGFSAARIRGQLSDGPTNASFLLEQGAFQYVLRVDKPAAAAQRATWPVARQRPGVRLSLERFQPDQEPVPGPGTIVHARDVLLVSGSQEAVDRLMVRFNLGVQPAESGDGHLAEVLLSHEVGVAEVLLTPRSAYVGRSLGQAHFAEKYNVLILSIRRGGRQIKPQNVRLDRAIVRPRRVRRIGSPASSSTSWTSGWPGVSSWSRCS